MVWRINTAGLDFGRNVSKAGVGIKALDEAVPVGRGVIADPSNTGTGLFRTVTNGWFGSAQIGSDFASSTRRTE